jgi:hypothetical protein
VTPGDDATAWLRNDYPTAILRRLDAVDGQLGLDSPPARPSSLGVLLERRAGCRRAVSLARDWPREAAGLLAPRLGAVLHRERRRDADSAVAGVYGVPTVSADCLRLSLRALSAVSPVAVHDEAVGGDATVADLVDSLARLVADHTLPRPHRAIAVDVLAALVAVRPAWTVDCVPADTVVPGIGRLLSDPDPADAERPPDATRPLRPTGLRLLAHVAAHDPDRLSTAASNGLESVVREATTADEVAVRAFARYVHERVGELTDRPSVPAVDTDVVGTLAAVVTGRDAPVDPPVDAPTAAALVGDIAAVDPATVAGGSASGLQGLVCAVRTADRVGGARLSRSELVTALGHVAAAHSIGDDPVALLVERARAAGLREDRRRPVVRSLGAHLATLQSPPAWIPPVLVHRVRHATGLDRGDATRAVGEVAVATRTAADRSVAATLADRVTETDGAAGAATARALGDIVAARGETEDPPVGPLIADVRAGTGQTRREAARSLGTLLARAADPPEPVGAVDGGRALRRLASRAREVDGHRRDRLVDAVATVVAAQPPSSRFRPAAAVDLVHLARNAAGLERAYPRRGLGELALATLTSGDDPGVDVLTDRVLDRLADRSRARTHAGLDRTRAVRTVGALVAFGPTPTPAVVPPALVRDARDGTAVRVDPIQALGEVTTLPRDVPVVEGVADRVATLDGRARAHAAAGGGVFVAAAEAAPGDAGRTLAERVTPGAADSRRHAARTLGELVVGVETSDGDATSVAFGLVTADREAIGPEPELVAREAARTLRTLGRRGDLTAGRYQRGIRAAESTDADGAGLVPADVEDPQVRAVLIETAGLALVDARGDAAVREALRAVLVEGTDPAAPRLAAVSALAGLDTPVSWAGAGIGMETETGPAPDSSPDHE